MNTTYLAHHGVLGMKWGVRRYQNKDGSLTAAGRARRNKDNFKDISKSHSKTKDSSRPLYADAETKAVIKNKVMNSNILNTPAMKQQLKELGDLRDKWRKLEDSTEDFYDSKYAQDASDKAYKLTYNWFKKNKPGFIKDIESKHGKNVDWMMIHDFRKAFEGYEDVEWGKAEKEWAKTDIAKNRKKADKAWDDHYNKSKEIGKQVADELLGTYANTKISKFDNYTYGDLVSSEVFSILNEMGYKKM